MKKKCFVLDTSSDFYDAIKKLDENGDGILPVTDSDGHFIGLVTDGDVRRAVLNKQLDLDHIVNQNPYKLTSESTQAERVNYLKNYRIRHLPIVDKNNKLIEIITLDNINLSDMSYPVVIMAGGLGSRLGDLTKNTPKPMLHVGGRPILETILISCIENGFYKFYISVNYKKEIIMDYFGDGSKWNVDIEYLIEDKKLGTAGALTLIKEKHSTPFLITNGDVITSLDYRELLKHHEKKKSKVTMCVRDFEYVVPFGVVEVDGDKISKISEKPTKSFKVNAGIYVVEPDVIDDIPKNILYDMTTLFEDVGNRKQGRGAYFLKDYWIDVGQVEELSQANTDLSLLSKVRS
jgi:dTDP-glucose pyrophosphorylase